MKVAQSCPTLCIPMDYTVHGILQVRILEWVAFPFSRGSSQPRGWTQVSCIAGRFFTNWVIREAPWPKGTQIMSLWEHRVLIWEGGDGKSNLIYRMKWWLWRGCWKLLNWNVVMRSVIWEDNLTAGGDWLSGEGDWGTVSRSLRQSVIVDSHQ